MEQNKKDWEPEEREHNCKLKGDIRSKSKNLKESKEVSLMAI